MRVLVTGGAGYIGSIVCEELLRDGHEVVVIDNLQQGHREAVPGGALLVVEDLKNQSAVRNLMKQHRIEAVIHMAADSQVQESVQNPRKYFANNVVNGLGLLDAMLDLDVRTFVFSSTAAVYGEPGAGPVAEDDPARPVNPYGATKLAFEHALQSYCGSYGMRAVSLRYFNAAGASEAHGEDHRPESHLIPLVLQAAMGRISQVTVYGDDYATKDGTCIRDYVHVVDLARAHVLALAHPFGFKAYNLGCGEPGYSVKDVIRAAREVTGREVPSVVAPRRAGDPAVLIASNGKITHELGWVPQRQDLGVIVESAWKWMQKHPAGY